MTGLLELIRVADLKSRRLAKPMQDWLMFAELRDIIDILNRQIVVLVVWCVQLFGGFCKRASIDLLTGTYTTD